MKIVMSKVSTILRCKCTVCSEFGKVQSLEMLPKNGIAMECIHENGIVHRWAEYDSMKAVLEKNKTKRDPPNMVKCPRCGKKGRVNMFHPDSARPDRVEYLIVHEKIKGTWGKIKMDKRRRCYIVKRQDREAVLKKLGRYIPPSATMEKYLK